MRKMNRYNHPLCKKQQRKQRHSSVYYDQRQNSLDMLLQELKAEASHRTDESRMTTGRNSF